MKPMLAGISQAGDYKALIKRNCMNVIRPLDRKKTSLNFDEVVKCAVTLGKRQFALNTKGAWILRFDDIIADALEPGALRTEETPLPKHIKENLESINLNDVPFDVISDVICFCIANKRDNTDWLHLPVANFDCYYGK